MPDQPHHKIRERSASYPSMPLNDAIERADKLHKSYGAGSYSREDAAKGMGYSTLSGAAARAVAALVHYGLLDRTGNAYTLSSLANEIMMPLSDEARTQAIVKAATSPQLFDKLVREYEGQALPSMLENIIFRNGVTRDASKEAAITLKDTLNFAGILKNGVITLSDVTNITSQVTVEDKSPDELIGANKIITAKNLEFGSTESGEGWILSVKSRKPLNSHIRKGLLDLMELLDLNDNN